MSDDVWIGIAAVAWARGRAATTVLGAVLLTVATYADECGIAWVGQETLGADCRRHKRTIIRDLDELEAAQLLCRVRQSDAFGHRDRNLLVLAPVGDRGEMLDLPQQIAAAVERKLRDPKVVASPPRDGGRSATRVAPRWLLSGAQVATAPPEQEEQERTKEKTLSQQQPPPGTERSTEDRTDVGGVEPPEERETNDTIEEVGDPDLEAALETEIALEIAAAHPTEMELDVERDVRIARHTEVGRRVVADTLGLTLLAAERLDDEQLFTRLFVERQEVAA